MKQINILIAILFFITSLSAQHDCSSHSAEEEKVIPVPKVEEAHSDCDGEEHEEEKEAHSDCDGDEHGDEDGDDEHKEDKEAHSDCDGDEHGDEDEHEDEDGHIELTSEMVKRVGIRIEQVEHAPVTSVITVPGDIQFNEDRITHVIPSYPSKAIKVNIRQGQWVRKGAVLATLSNRETLSQYVVRAPLSGRVITKHLTAGEVVSDSDTLFTIANLATVWAEFAVPQDRLDGITRNSEMMISLVGHEDEQVVAKVNYISPITDPLTRRVTVRASVNNKENEFRPGSYVTARINYGDPQSVIAVEHDAVQRIDGETVLFIPVEDEENAFKPVPVITGKSNSRYFEILSGIHEDDNYVTDGAFALKAQMVTADMDPHAGHNH